MSKILWSFALYMTRKNPIKFLPTESDVRIFITTIVERLIERQTPRLASRKTSNGRTGTYSEGSMDRTQSVPKRSLGRRARAGLREASLRQIYIYIYHQWDKSSECHHGGAAKGDGEEHEGPEQAGVEPTWAAHFPRRLAVKQRIKVINQPMSPPLGGTFNTLRQVTCFFCCGWF